MKEKFRGVRYGLLCSTDNGGFYTPRCRGKKPSWKDSQRYRSLNLLLFGGAIFGIIDHLWNGELFLVGPNILSDLTLGFAITLAIIGIWGVMVYLEEISQKSTSKAAN